MKKSSRKSSLILKKSQNENLKTHKVHLDLQINFSKSHIYRDVLKRFKLETYELEYGKNC
jgi:hypothetical protein